MCLVPPGQRGSSALAIGYLGGNVLAQAMKINCSDDILNASHYEKLRRPPEKAETFAALVLYQPSLPPVGVERLFRSLWSCVGRVERLPYPDDSTAPEA